MGLFMICLDENVGGLLMDPSKVGSGAIELRSVNSEKRPRLVLVGKEVPKQQLVA